MREQQILQKYNEILEDSIRTKQEVKTILEKEEIRNPQQKTDYPVKFAGKPRIQLY